MLAKKERGRSYNTKFNSRLAARCDCMFFVHPCMRVQAEMLSKKKDRE